MDDALNRSVSTVFDSLDRVIATVDGGSDKLQFAYNFASELVTFIDANNHSTGFTRDALGRISTITYPDTTTEVFDYYANSDLLRYTDNQSRQQEFLYDSADRLSQINFLADATNVQFFFDGVGNRVKMIERGGDICLYQFDPLNRQVGDQRKGSGGAPSWQHTRGFDPTSNQLVLYTNPSLFGSAVFGTSPVGTGTVFWEVPSPGYDSMNRMPAFQDAASNTVSQGFDVENRRTLLSWLSGSLTQAASYDITGRLLRLLTQYSATTIGQLDYGYDAASQRISLVTLTDTFDYEMDGASRLVGEAVNRFVERRTAQFADGNLVRTWLDQTNQRVQLLAFDDSFAGTTLDLSRWAVRQIPIAGATPLMGYEIRQRDGLQMAFPTGYTTNQNSDLTYCDYYGRSTANLVQCVEHQILLNGDFDIALDFAQFQFAAASLAAFSLTITSAPNYSNLATQNGFYVGIGQPGGLYSYMKDVFVNGGSVAFHQVATSDQAGSLRLKRVGTTVTFYYFSGGVWVNPSSWTYTGLNFTTAYVNLQLNTINSNTSITLSNFRSLDANVPLYPPTGTYESTVYDAGRSVSWTRISWEQAVPGGTGISFQVAVAAAIDGPYTYVGPDGTSGTFFTTAAGQTLPTLNGRYGRYKAYLTSTGAATPNFGNVQISYSGTETSTLTVTDYDPAGNITLRTITTNAGIVTDVRNNGAWPAGDQINNLNQIKRRDFGGVTWRYTYQGDGCTASRTDGTNTWTNTWDPAGLQHLQRVQGPGGIDVNYTNDYLGRMLTRVSGASTTVFQWDGWDCIGETTGATTTRWYAPQGQLLSFDRGGTSYEVISDALGSVRQVISTTGTVVCSFTYGAWGEVLPGSFDNLPGGMPYRYVGSLGVRTDTTTGLYYMRQRWYDPAVQRFISRDPIGLKGGVNLYCYCENSPTNRIDPTGLDCCENKCIIVAEYVNVQGRYKHINLHLICPDGTTTEWSFGPENPFPPTVWDFGRLEGGRIPPGGRQPRPDGSGYSRPFGFDEGTLRVVIADCVDKNSTIKIFDDITYLINIAQYDYAPYGATSATTGWGSDSGGKTSNSAARALLESAGIRYPWEVEMQNNIDTPGGVIPPLRGAPIHMNSPGFQPHEYGVPTFAPL